MEAAKVTAKIDEQLKEDKKSQEKTVKLLLLGSGESGKSTFLKQLRIINGDGFDDDYRSEMIPVIRSNLMQATRSILAAMATLYIQFGSNVGKDASVEVFKVLNETQDGNQSNWADADEYIDISIQNLMTISNAIVKLWKDSGFRACYDRRREYQLIDSAEYFLDKTEQICDPAYKPDNQDILRSRKKTTTIVESVIDIKKVKIKVIDVGGQRRERRKWIQCFDNVTSIIFLSSLSDYDLKIQEDNQTNRMSESLKLFETILEYPWFKKKSIILFLNKKDSFEKKFPLSPLSNYFHEYTGSATDPEEGKMFIRDLFEAKKAPPAPDQDPVDQGYVYTHFTCATDTDNITRVFKDVQEIILRTYLNEFNLV